jgi:hypothetical protein
MKFSDQVKSTVPLPRNFIYVVEKSGKRACQRARIIRIWLPDQTCHSRPSGTGSQNEISRGKVSAHALKSIDHFSDPAPHIIHFIRGGKAANREAQ